MNISNLNLNENFAGDSSAALAIQKNGGNINIENSNFTKNICSVGNGGAMGIYYSSGKIEIINSLFYQNSAFGSGGGIEASKILD